jgi:hypothetical protein
MKEEKVTFTSLDLQKDEGRKASRSSFFLLLAGEIETNVNRFSFSSSYSVNLLLDLPWQILLNWFSYFVPSSSRSSSVIAPN